MHRFLRLQSRPPTALEVAALSEQRLQTELGMQWRVQLLHAQAVAPGFLGSRRVWEGLEAETAETGVTSNMQRVYIERMGRSRITPEQDEMYRCAVLQEI